MEQEKQLTEKESLDLITMMINKAKDANHDTGVSAIMWGSVIAVCSLVKLAELHFGFRLPFDIFLLTFIAVIPQILMSIREARQRKVKTYDDVYRKYIWIAFGISIFLMIFITNNVFQVWSPVYDEYSTLAGHPSPFQFQEFVTPLFLLLYGMPTFITGAACKFKPMLWGGLICWACCIITIYTPVKVDMALTAFSAISAWLIPGIILEKDYRKAKKELAAAHV